MILHLLVGQRFTNCVAIAKGIIIGHLMIDLAEALLRTLVIVYPIVVNVVDHVFERLV